MWHITVLRTKSEHVIYDSMSAAILKRKSYTPEKGIPLIGDLTLAPNRVHEFCGPARRRLAVMLASEMSGPIFWISNHWETDRIYPPALLPHVDPGRITFVRPKRPIEILWAMEEVLRSGVAPLCVAELAEPPALTPVRRLNLAATQAHETWRCYHLGVLLIPGDGGAQGTESRWYMRPDHGVERTAWSLERRRARMSAPKTWAVEWAHDLPKIQAVSERN